MVPDVLLEQDFFPAHPELFSELLRGVAWDESMNARKTASFGVPYNYSQMSYPTTDIPSCLEGLCLAVTQRLDVPFNNCLLNYYESGQNTMGFHSDETNGLLRGTGVAIVSLGSQRKISFRSMDRQTTVDFDLQPGSLLYLGENVQAEWMHAIRKQDDVGPRISLTWRAVQ